eukprot:3738148-Karenia_brevis.AAC.1
MLDHGVTDNIRVRSARSQNALLTHATPPYPTPPCGERPMSRCHGSARQRTKCVFASLLATLGEELQLHALVRSARACRAQPI